MGGIEQRWEKEEGQMLLWLITLMGRYLNRIIPARDARASPHCDRRAYRPPRIGMRAYRPVLVSESDRVVEVICIMVAFPVLTRES
jgi:hypothetical protein